MVFFLALSLIGLLAVLYMRRSVESQLRPRSEIGKLHCYMERKSRLQPLSKIGILKRLSEGGIALNWNSNMYIGKCMSSRSHCMDTIMYG